MGDCVQVLGPLGRGFAQTDNLNYALLIAGGVAPLYPLAQGLVRQGVRVTCMFGPAAPKTSWTAMLLLPLEWTYYAVPKTEVVIPEDGAPTC